MGKRANDAATRHGKKELIEDNRAEKSENLRVIILMTDGGG